MDPAEPILEQNKFLQDSVEVLSSSPVSTVPPPLLSLAGIRPKVYPSRSSPGGSAQRFARSARKRESVYTLPSIQHLQHRFAKLGASMPNPSASPTATGIPSSSALPSPSASSSSRPVLAIFGQLEASSIEFDNLPPTPMAPVAPTARPAAPRGKALNTDIGAMRPGVVKALRAAERVFLVGPDAAALATGDEAALVQPVDVLDLLRTTITVVRTVRSYVVAIPDGAFPGSAVPSPKRHLTSDRSASSTPPAASSSVASDITSESSLRPRTSATSLHTHHPPPPFHHTFSTPSRPSHLSSRYTQSRSSSLSASARADDPVAQIRRAALNVLSAVRLVEERYRLPDAEEDDARALSSIDLRVRTRTVSESSSGSVVEEPAWDLGWTANKDPDASRERVSWEDQLGRAYHSVAFVDSPTLSEARQQVRVYLDLVDALVFGGRETATRGWEIDKKDRLHRNGTSPSNKAFAAGFQAGKDIGTASNSLEEEKWRDGSQPVLVRLLSLLAYLIPADHPVAYLALEEATTLETFSDGQLLGILFNLAVRCSSQPWGFIPAHEIHDVLGDRRRNLLSSTPESAASLQADEDGQLTSSPRGKKEWVFRKIANLRLFAAALKMRYLLPLVVGQAPTGSPSLHFDPQQVAKREPGWETMLEAVVGAWLDRVAEEACEHEAESFTEEGESDGELV